MSHRDNQHALADAAASAIVIGLITAVVFLLRIVSTVVIRTYITYYGRHPFTLTLLPALWLLSLLAALAVGQVPSDTTVAVAAAVVATVTFVAIIALLEIVYNHLAPKAQPDDDLLQNLPDWWS